VHLLGGEVGGLELDIGVAPGPRDNDRGTDIAELAGHPLGGARAVVALALVALRTGPEEDHVMAPRATGDVDLVDGAVLGHVSTDVSPAVNGGDIAGIGEFGKSCLQHRAEVIVDRVHLEQAAAALGIELVEHVERGDRGHVAGDQRRR